MKTFKVYIDPSLSLEVPNSGFVSWMRDLRSKYDSGGGFVDKAKDAFFTGVRGYYKSFAVPSASLLQRAEVRKAIAVLHSLKNHFPELTPDYSYIYRGRSSISFARIIDHYKGAWKPLGQDWMVSRSTYKVPIGMSSWTYAEPIAWIFTFRATVTPISGHPEPTLTSVISRAEKYVETIDNKFEPINGYFFPHILRMPVNSNTLYNMATADAMSGIMGYPIEREVIQLGAGPFNVDVITPRIVYEMARDHKLLL